MLETRLIAIESRLTKIETVLDRLDHYLLGNGQPGELTRIHTRLDSLEEFKWRAVGALGVAVLLYEVIVKLILKG